MLETYLKNIIARDKLSTDDIAKNVSFYRYGDQNGPTINYSFIQYVIENYDKFKLSKSLFENTSSKELFDLLILYKSLGYEYIKLPKNTENYQSFVKVVDTSPINIKINRSNIIPIRHKFLNEYYVEQYDFNVITSNGFLINCLYNNQYTYDKDVKIKVEAGDIVLDCGACWGDTSILFSKLCGENGKVVSFEFEESNLKIFNQNLEINKSINNIVLVDKALDEVSNKRLSYRANLSGTNLSKEGENYVQTISIDDAVNLNKLNKVDFIKMDIEGSELNALKGAIRTIEKYKPKLAISVYHKYNDFIAIPNWIKNNFPDYKLYLDHHTIHSEETILYASKG